jgi:hypothetical protein
MRAVTILLTILLIALLPLINAGSEKITIESITVREGMDAKVKIILDSAPKGLAGYDVTLILRDFAVANIIKVEFPPWAKLSDSSIRNNSIKLKAVDLEDRIRPGSTDIELASIVFGNTKQGESMIELTVNKMDDDEGNPITPIIEFGKLTVTAPPSTQTAVTTPFPTQTTTTAISPITTQIIYTATTITTPIPTYITQTYTYVSTADSSIVLAFLAFLLIAVLAIVGVLLIALRTAGRVRRRPRVVGVRT